MMSLLHFIPIILVIDPFVAFFFKRHNKPAWQVKAKDIGEQLINMIDDSIKDLLDKKKIAMSRKDMTSQDTKFLHSELYISHLFIATCSIHTILKNKNLENEICDHMFNFFYPRLITRQGMIVAEVEGVQDHLYERFNEYTKIMEENPNKKWLLPLATRAVENIRGQGNNNTQAIENMISEIALLINQVPVVFQKMQCEYAPITPDYYPLKPKRRLYTPKRNSLT